jgi:hypothetical protein
MEVVLDNDGVLKPLEEFGTQPQRHVSISADLPNSSDWSPVGALLASTSADAVILQEIKRVPSSKGLEPKWLEQKRA